MRRIVLMICAALLLALWSVLAATAKKRAKPAPVQEEATLEGLLGRDLAAAVEAAGEAYDAAEALLGRQRKRGRPTALIRGMGEVRADYAKALQRARNARVDEDNSLLRDQVVVSLSQSIRACDLIVQGLRDGDEDQVQAGIELAGMAQGDLDSLVEGGPTAAVAGGPSQIGPSLGLNVGMSSQTGGFNMSSDVSVSVPVSKAQDVGLGGSMTVNSSESASSSSGSLSFGGNIFSRYHFLGAFSGKPNWVPYVGAKTGLRWGTQWQGQGLSFSTTDSLGVEFAGQLGMLIFVDASSAVTLQLETGSTSTTSETSTSTSTSSSATTGLSLGLRRMF
jgi:hypothetical protein